MTSFFYVVSIATCRSLFKPSVSLLSKQENRAASNFYRTFKVSISFSLVNNGSCKDKNVGTIDNGMTASS